MMKNITGITNINTLLNTMKMQNLWEMKKQDPERARIEKEQKQKQILEGKACPNRGNIL